MLELPPGPAADGERHSHHGEECLLCVEGRVRLVHGEQELVLETGDSCHFDGRIAHSIENLGPATGAGAHRDDPGGLRAGAARGRAAGGAGREAPGDAGLGIALARRAARAYGAASAPHRMPLLRREP